MPHNLRMVSKRIGIAKTESARTGIARNRKMQFRTNPDESMQNRLGNEPEPEQEPEALGKVSKSLEKYPNPLEKYSNTLQKYPNALEKYPNPKEKYQNPFNTYPNP